MYVPWLKPTLRYGILFILFLVYARCSVTDEDSKPALIEQAPQRESKAVVDDLHPLPLQDATGEVESTSDKQENNTANSIAIRILPGPWTTIGIGTIACVAALSIQPEHYKWATNIFLKEFFQKVMPKLLLVIYYKFINKIEKSPIPKAQKEAFIKSVNDPNPLPLQDATGEVESTSDKQENNTANPIIRILPGPWTTAGIVAGASVVAWSTQTDIFLKWASQKAMQEFGSAILQKFTKKIEKLHLPKAQKEALIKSTQKIIEKTIKKAIK